MDVGRVCNRSVHVALKDTPIREAARLMRQLHVGDLIVVEEDGKGQRPVGIVTDRDIVVEVLGEDVAESEVSVGDIMSTELLTAHENDCVLDTIKRMRNHGVRRVPVVDSKRILTGVLAVDDLIPLMAEQLTDLSILFSRERKQEWETR